MSSNSLGETGERIGQVKKRGRYGSLFVVVGHLMTQISKTRRARAGIIRDISNDQRSVTVETFGDLGPCAECLLSRAYMDLRFMTVRTRWPQKEEMNKDTLWPWKWLEVVDAMVNHLGF